MVFSPPVSMLFCTYSRRRLSRKASYTPLTRIGPERAKIVRSHAIVSIETIMAAPIAMNGVKYEVVNSLSLTSMRPSGIQIFRLTELSRQHYSFKSQ